MIIVLDPGLADENLRHCSALAKRLCLDCRALDQSVDGGRRILQILARSARPDPDLVAQIKLWPGVEHVLDFESQEPLLQSASPKVQLAPRWAAQQDGFASGDGEFGCSFSAQTFVWIAGPCAVENPEYLGEIGRAVAHAGASMLRGGAFKPRTSPYSFPGLGRDGLLLLAAVARDVSLPFVTEVLDPRDVDFVAQHADMLQIGARSMQNYSLLQEVGACGRPVLLKRGPSASTAEFLSAAEHVLAAGCSQLVLCERGIKSFDSDRRNVLDLALVPAIKERLQLPVIVDPSHACGRRSLVRPLAKAAVAVGADGVMVEVHCQPMDARSDAAQALRLEDLEPMARELRSLAALEQRRIPCNKMARSDQQAQAQPQAQPLPQPQEERIRDMDRGL